MSDTDRAGAATVRAAPRQSLIGALLDVTGNAVVVVDNAGRYVGASRPALDMVGYAESELLDGRPTAVLAEGTNLNGLAHAARNLDTGQTLTLRIVLCHKRGHSVPVEATVRCARDNGNLFYVATARATVPTVRAQQKRSSANASEPLPLAAAPEPLSPATPDLFPAAPDLPAYFAVAVSHELRTPLTTILGSAEALLRAWVRLDNVARRQAVERLLSAARRLDLLVRDLLLVTGIEEGDLTVTPCVTPLAPLLEQALYDASAVHPNLDVRARGLRDAPLIYADPDRVVQVLVHLLDNAARHGQGAGPPEVRIETQARAVEIRVSDRGPGLPREGRDRLFTRFGKLSQDSHAGRVGTGLGLYLCRQLVERMGGTMGVQSTPGKGASFWFTLPLADHDQGAPV